MPRSLLFVPGHRPDMHDRALGSGADAVVLDLEDAVPPDQRQFARTCVAATLATGEAWVRINPARTESARLDLDAVAATARGVRVAKVDDPVAAEWVVSRLPSRVPMLCAIESARAVQAASEIATVPGVAGLTMGGLDLAGDLGVEPDSPALDAVRVSLVIASAAASVAPPIDTVHARHTDDDGLRVAAERARALGFGGKSAIHPRQVPVINEAFSPSAQELAWAGRVTAAWAASGGEPTTTTEDEFVDPPVVARARRFLARME